MANRFKHIRSLVDIRRKIKEYPDSADNILMMAIIQSLPAQHAARA